MLFLPCQQQCHNLGSFLGEWLVISSLSGALLYAHTPTHSMYGVLCTPERSVRSAIKFLEGKVSVVVAQCLTYDLVHCLLNDLGEERGSVMCRIGEEARTSISKGYFCTKIEPEPLCCPQCAAPLEPGLSYKFPPGHRWWLDKSRYFTDGGSGGGVHLPFLLLWD